MCIGNRLTSEYISKWLWPLAIFLFGIGDLVTTVYFIHVGIAVESHPIASLAVESYGLWILGPWKAISIIGFYGLYRLAPENMAIGVPIGLILLGGFTTVWNTAISVTGTTPL